MSEATFRPSTTDFQKAFDNRGAEFEADIAIVKFSDGVHTPQATVDPGQQLEHTLWFDLPKDTTLTRVELHESVLSTGAVVSVG